MTDEKKEWDFIEIRYCGGEYVRINKGDLDKIDAIADVTEALKRAKDLVASLRYILGD